MVLQLAQVVADSFDVSKEVFVDAGSSRPLGGSTFGDKSAHGSKNVHLQLKICTKLTSTFEWKKMQFLNFSNSLLFSQPKVEELRCSGNFLMLIAC